MSDAFDPTTAAPVGTPTAPAFDPKTAQPADDHTKTGGYLPNFAAGFGEGVTGGLDLLDRAINPARKVADIFNQFGGTETKIPVADQAMYNKLLGHVGMNPDDVAAKSLPERLSRFAGQGATALLIPGPGEAGLFAAGGRALTGMVAGMAGGEAAWHVPDPIKPIVGLFASLAAGIPFSFGISAAAKLPGQIKRATDLARASGSSDVAERMAGSVLAANATNVQSVKDMITSKGVGQIVPGSEPTTFQATGDMGLGALERATATKNPELFRQREAEQNAARITALQGVQTGANPTAVADFFRGQLRDLDGQTATNIEERIDLARQTAAQIGGDVPPEQLGQTMRDAVVGARDKTKVAERGLWNAIDPDGNMTGNVKYTADAADKIVGKMRKTEKPMAGEEAAIFNAARALPEITPVADLVALRSRVSTEMSEELMTHGNTPSYARLVQLRGAIQDNLSKTISDQAVKEAPKIVAGEIAPDESITARIMAWRKQWEADREQSLQQRQAGDSSTGSIGGPAAGGPVPAAGPGGAALPPGGGPPGTQSAPGLSQNAPTFDAAAAQRLAEATAATKQRAQTFGLGPVGQVLRTAGSQNIFRLADSGVPGQFFNSKATAFEDAQRLTKAIGPEKATALLTDAAAASLRKAAMTEDGILDPRKTMLWQNKYQDALRALPEDIRNQFMNARNAGDAVAEATMIRDQAMKAMQAGKVGQLLGVRTPEEVTNIVGQTFSSPQAPTLMKGIADAVKGDPDARAGLRQAVADHIAKRFISNTEVGTSGLGGIKADEFQTFVKQNGPALRAAGFGPADMDTLKAIAEDIRQAKRSQTAVRLVGGSNTAQDIAAVGKQTSILTKLMFDTVAGAAATHTGPFGMFAAALGTHTMQALRDAGIANVDQLVTRAMLDPVLARRLLDKAPAATMLPAQDAAFARAVRRSIAPALATATNAQRIGASQ